MTKEQIIQLFNTYGTEENDKMLRKNYSLIFLMLILSGVLINNILPELRIYFGLVELAMSFSLVCMYFFKKKKNAHRFKWVKVVCMYVSFAMLVVVALPMLILFFLLNCVAHNTDKIYVLKRNPMCFCVEIVFHMMLIWSVICQTLLKPNDILFLIVTYSIFFCFQKFFSMLIRGLLITGKNKDYERYRYKNEVNVISEYMFLIASTISILCSTTQYTNAFVPILLWYSIKQLSNYRNEKKNENLKRKFLLDSFESLRELEEVFLDILEEKLVIADYVDCERIGKYRKVNSKSKWWSFSKKRIDYALEALETLSKKRYKLPKEKERAREEIQEVFGHIVKCL